MVKLNQWRGFPAALAERVREHKRRTKSAKKVAAAAAAGVGGPSSEVRPQGRSKAAHGGSNRTKARQAAPSPATQPEKQPASHMPVKVSTAHRDEAVLPQQSPADAELPLYTELPPQTAAEQSKGQASGDKGDSATLEQPESTESQAALQRAQARKQKAARRKAAKNKGANTQTKTGADSSDLSASSIIGDSNSQRSSSEGHTAPEPAPKLSQVVQQSTSQFAQSIGLSSEISDGADAAPHEPCPPDAPNGQPTIAQPAPVRLSKTTLQHSRSSPTHSRPPPLHALLPTFAPQLQQSQV